MKKVLIVGGIAVGGALPRVESDRGVLGSVDDIRSDLLRGFGERIDAACSAHARDGRENLGVAQRDLERVERAVGKTGDGRTPGIGALLALQMAGMELSVIAFIGVILLIGIVKKNGIMLVDFAIDAERRRGLSPEEAIYEACLARFRPILMTTMAALLGAVPLVVAMGPGAELRRPLGITIIAGLVVSQVLTLYTTPVIYLLLDKLHRRLWGAAEGLKEGLPADDPPRVPAE